MEELKNLSLPAGHHLVPREEDPGEHPFCPSSLLHYYTITTTTIPGMDQAETDHRGIKKTPKSLFVHTNDWMMDYSILEFISHYPVLLFYTFSFTRHMYSVLYTYF